MHRRQFLLTATGAALSPLAAPISGHARQDVTYEPDQELESTGLRIRDGVKILRDGEQGNIPPVIREEILDNPNAVFIIETSIRNTMRPDGTWNRSHDQMERLGRRVAGMVFRRGTGNGGRTFIKPNLVGIGNVDDAVFEVQSGIVDPFLIVGIVDGLRDSGNQNVAISARGALRHPTIVKSGLGKLFDKHDLPFIEAHLQYFEDYGEDELLWHENPAGVIQRRFCTYKPAYMDGTTFINIAHAHTHKVGHTTLTLKNIQGIMPRGYGHICDSWTTLDMWRRPLMDDFNRDYRRAIEESYIRHARIHYKYWDDGGYFASYRAAGGYERFTELLKKYEKSRDNRNKREKALNDLIAMADTRIFWPEIWAQRMMDIIEVIPQPHLSMVDCVYSRGSAGTLLNNNIILGKSMVAVDAVTTWIMGHDPREVPYLRIANERGLGQNDIEQIPLFRLTEHEIERIADYRRLKRYYQGINNLGIPRTSPCFY